MGWPLAACLSFSFLPLNNQYCHAVVEALDEATICIYEVSLMLSMNISEADNIHVRQCAVFKMKFETKRLYI